MGKVLVNGEEVTKADLCRRVLALNPAAGCGEIARQIFKTYGVRVNTGTAFTVREKFAGAKPVVNGGRQKKEPAVVPDQKGCDINLFIEAMKHVKQAVKLLGNRDNLIEIINLV